MSRTFETNLSSHPQLDIESPQVKASVLKATMSSFQFVKKESDEPKHYQNLIFCYLFLNFKSAGQARKALGGGCEGGEAIFKSGGKTLNNVDTLLALGFILFG